MALILVSATTWGKRDDKEFYCKLQECWRNYGCIPILIQLRYSAGQKRRFIFSFPHSPFPSSFPMVLPFFSSMSQQGGEFLVFLLHLPTQGWDFSVHLHVGLEDLSPSHELFLHLTPCDCRLPTPFFVLLWNWDGVQSLLVRT